MEAPAFAALGAEVDQKQATYEEALDAYLGAGTCSNGHRNPPANAFCGACGEQLPEFDEAAAAEFAATRDDFAQSRTVWRLLGEQEGHRVGGPVVEDEGETE